MTLSIVQLAAVLILGVSSFLSGWMLRRIQAKSREAQLQKHLTDANTAIPSLETNVRNRDQRIASLFSELTEWKAKVPTLEASTKRKEVEVLAKDRELRAARVEIDALKATVAAVPVADPAKLEELETTRAALRDAQLRCSALTAAVAERDVRLASVTAAVPSFIALPVAPATESEGELQVRIAALESGVAAREAQIAELQTQLEAERETQRTVRADVESRTAEIERMRGEDAKWQTRVPKLVATIKARDVTVAERDALLATRDTELADRMAALAQRDQAIAAAQAQLDQQRASNASLSASVQHGEARVADLSSQLASMSQQLEAAAAHHAAKLATALRLGREELDGHNASLERLKAENLAQSSRSRALEAELAALQSQLREATQTAAADAQRHAAAEAALRAQITESEQRSARSHELSREQHVGLETQNVALEQQLTRAAEQHAQLKRQLDQQGALANEQRAALERANEEQRAQFEHRLAEADELVATVEKHLSEATARTALAEQRLSVEQQRHGESAASVASLLQAQSELESRLLEAEQTSVAFEQQIETLQNEHGETEQRMREAEREASERVAQDTEEQTIELVELRDEVRTLHTRVAPLESLLKQRDSALFERGERIETMTSQIQALVAQNESLQATLRQRGEKIATLERKFSDQPPPPVAADSADRRGDHLEQRLVAQIERNRELTKIVEERDRDLAGAAKANELNGKSMLILKQQLDDARATEERLATQVRELKSASQRAPEVDGAAVRSPMSKPQGLFELPPEHVDELQQIRGIGDGFERGLNKLGIYQFSQLAGLSAQEIVWIEAHLPTFHGRVDRDDWPGQAAALMAATEHAEWSLRAQNAPAMSPRIN